METGALRTEEEMRRAIREMQLMAHLPVTGEFDDATLKKMQEPRCGVPDVDLGPSSRGKRYAIFPSKWEKKQLSFR